MVCLKRKKLLTLLLMVFMFAALLSVVMPGSNVVLAASKYTITGSTAGASQSGNPAANSHDGNTSTRWANTGSVSNAWIQYDLGSSKNVTEIRLMMYNGGTRTYPIKVEVGDGTLTQVWSGTTSLTSGMQTINVTDRTGRYVRITMTGNNSDGNGWFSIIEAEIWGESGGGGPTPTPAPGGILEINHINVNKGDAALIITPNKKTLLIDTGSKWQWNTLNSYITNKLAEKGLSKIDYILLTHHHPDHTDNLLDVVNAPYGSNIQRIYYNAMSSSAPEYSSWQSMVSKINSTGCPKTALKADDTMDIGDSSISIKVLSPYNLSMDGNNSSVVIRLTYGNTHFMLTGDAKDDAENVILSRYSASQLRSNVLKTGHHGDNNATDNDWINAVLPSSSGIRYVIISANGTQYHPGKQLLDRLYNAGVVIYGTWGLANGHIKVTSDGSNVTVTPSHGSPMSPPWDKYFN